MGQQTRELIGPRAPTARELVLRLVSRVGAPPDDLSAGALATHGACERTYRELTRSLGEVGARELLVRATSLAQEEHPVLKELRVGRQSRPDVAAVAAVVQEHGPAAVTAGLESMLETMLTLLGRLVGDDLVARLVEPSMPRSTEDDRDAPA